MVYTKQYYVYIITNYQQTTFYIGITHNLEQRMWEHKNKIYDGFSAKYNLNRLVYYECFDDVNYAIAREKQLKNWHRQWKLNLIRDMNPDFKDISIDIGLEPETKEIT